MSSADRTLYMITAGEKIGTTPFGNPIRTLKNPGLGVDAYVLDTGKRLMPFYGRVNRNELIL